MADDNGMVYAADHLWHKACFRCSGQCGKAFFSQSASDTHEPSCKLAFFVLDGLPFCEDDYLITMGRVCDGCGDPVKQGITISFNLITKSSIDTDKQDGETMDRRNERGQKVKKQITKSIRVLRHERCISCSVCGRHATDDEANTIGREGSFQCVVKNAKVCTIVDLQLYR